MERLTNSPYVIDIYSHCGQTVLNEYATFGNDKNILRDFTKVLRAKTGEDVLKIKLKAAAMIAEAVQHVHEIDGINNATMVHYDINPSNVVVTHGGIPKLNDFNVAHLFYWDVVKNERCPFRSHLSTPWWRAPEEMETGTIIDGKLNRSFLHTHVNIKLYCNHIESNKLPCTGHKSSEKVDIYSLGNILYQLLVGHSARGRSIEDRKEEVRSTIKNGIPPWLSPSLVADEDPGISALVQAMSECYQPNPKDRSNARNIALNLRQAYELIYPTNSE